MSKTHNKLSDLNNHLFEELERLNDESLTGDKLQEERERAKSMANIAQTIINNGELALKAVKHFDEYGKEISNIAEITAYKNATYLLDYDGNVYACGEGYGKVAVKISNIENVTKVSGNYGITVDNKAINLETKAVVSGLENVIDISSPSFKSEILIFFPLQVISILLSTLNV